MPKGGVFLGGICLGGCLPSGVSAWRRCLSEGIPPLWTEFLTHACENITFLQVLLRMVIRNGLVFDLQVFQTS